MAWSFRDVVDDVVVGDAIQEDRISYLPLRRRSASNLHYVTVDRAIAAGVLEITETSEQGQVPVLRVINKGADLVFIPDGSMLIGCKQNRIVAVSILLAPDSVTQIPVNCVEAGRWRREGHSFSTMSSGDKKMRALLSKQTKRSLERDGRIMADQGDVWDEVRESLGEVQALSGTSDYFAAFDKVTPKELAPATLPNDACGVALVVDGKVETIDLFDRPETLHEVWPRLARGYRLAAYRQSSSKRSNVAIDDVFQAVASATPTPFTNIGVGETFRVQAPLVVGAALVEKGSAVHVSLFTEEETK